MSIAKNLGELKSSGYIYKTIKDELRDNLIQKIKNGDRVFEGIIGYDDTVLPDMQRAILSKHNVLLLGLRGQAKTRMARLTVQLLDEFIPVIQGSELLEDPLHPISYYGKQQAADMGDDMPIQWIGRDERIIEKLATPDVSIADLIGDIDPVKAANNKWSFADERSIHFGLIPRSNRSIFILNELPDLQPRIQVSLLNILQEGDIQIRGYKLRLPLDIQFIFTANPEDYTNRGNIITPLKDRIDSQILTHYPEGLDIAKQITLQEAAIDPNAKQRIYLSPHAHDILERISVVARQSEYIDENSGVSARMSIAGLENLYSSAELRLLKSKADETAISLIDFISVIPAITGKIELLYEGEQLGAFSIALGLIGEATKEQFLSIFPNPEQKLKKDAIDPYHEIKEWFSNGNQLAIQFDDTDDTVYQKLSEVAGLTDLVVDKIRNKQEAILLMQLVLFGMSELNLIAREMLDKQITFADSLADIIGDIMNDDFDDDDLNDI